MMMTRENNNSENVKKINNEDENCSEKKQSNLTGSNQFDSTNFMINSSIKQILNQKKIVCS